MKDKLPEVFPVPFNKKLHNTQELFYDNLNQERKDNNDLDYLTIENKINRIFNSKDYIYKKNVTIETQKNGKKNYIIIGRTNNSLITKENEKINIDDIVDIKID